MRVKKSQKIIIKLKFYLNNLLFKNITTIPLKLFPFYNHPDTKEREPPCLRIVSKQYVKTIPFNKSETFHKRQENSAFHKTLYIRCINNNIPRFINSDITLYYTKRLKISRN